MPGILDWFAPAHTCVEPLEERVGFRLPSWAIDPVDGLESLSLVREKQVVESVGSVAELRSWFAEHEQEYQVVVEAATRPGVYARLGYSVPLQMYRWISVGLPLDLMLQALRIKSQLHLYDGQQRQCVDDLMKMVSVIEASRIGPSFTVSGHLRVLGFDYFCDSVGEVLRQGGLEERGLRRIQSGLLTIDALKLFDDSMRLYLAEHLFLLELPRQERIGAFYSEPVTLLGQGSGVLAKDSWGRRWRVYREQREMASERSSARMKILLARCLTEWRSAVNLEERRVFPSIIRSELTFSGSPLDDPDNEISRPLGYLRDGSYVASDFVSIQTMLDQLYLACGLEAYRLIHGGYPAELYDLVPRHAEVIPNDIFSGAPLKYRREGDDGYAIWSVGWDEDDDGGKPGLYQNGEPVYGTGDEDWVWTFRARGSR